MTNFKTYKIDLSPEEEDFLRDRKTKTGISISYSITEAVKMYIEAIQEKEARNG